MRLKSKIKATLLAVILLLANKLTIAQEHPNFINLDGKDIRTTVLFFLIGMICLIIAVAYLQFKKVKEIGKNISEFNKENVLKDLNIDQLKTFINRTKKLGIFILLTLSSITSFAQTAADKSKPLMSQPGIIITVLLIAIPILLAAWLIIIRATKTVKKFNNQKRIKLAETLAQELKNEESHETENVLKERISALEFSLENNELGGAKKANDDKGLILNVGNTQEVHFTAVKRKAAPRPALEPEITKLVVWYLGCAAFWLVVGTGVGEYVGIKFIAPDVDQVSWLSFGRLRPVHTNMVFWGWASLGMMGLGYYVVPMVSNTKLYSIKWGWIALVLTNLQVTIGSISLMAGINNGGGEFREYIWPIMALLAVALILTVINFIKTIANRTTKEIYISNWYIVSSLLFTIIIALTAYLPFWQNGLGETIVQGYYMHTGVGMWFTLFTLGLLYYFVPQQLNKPIYAYSLGILAFWTQILFYTIIGTHHFIFSSIPWWLQTVAIVGSVGMIIPVVAATINYMMTFKGQWDKVSNSYTLPFFLVAVVYYFIVSMQGTAEAFRFTNLLWHFTDFTVAHSHLGFYGIISFAIWGGAYAIIPRLTRKEPPQHLVGAHFWLAFIGLILYCFPLMFGATLKGMMWMEGKPFIDSVVKMFDYWVWRAIGGSLMFFSHLIFFYNFYKMSSKSIDDVNVVDEAIKILEQEPSTVK
jgi:cytochrome c oxidase cbb3-type subunit 1